MTQAQPTDQDRQGDRLLDVVVVGGSQAGLAVAWHLAQQGLRFVVLEAGPDVGHVWRSRWDSLRLFTPAQYDALPGMAFPAPADTYPTKDPVADYLPGPAGGGGHRAVPGALRPTDRRQAGRLGDPAAQRRLLQPPGPAAGAGAG